MTDTPATDEPPARSPLEMLNALGVSFVEDPFLVRGLDYYTETAFELETSVLEGAQTAFPE